MFYFVVITAYSISFAAIIGIVRFRKIDRSFRPFVIICVAALLNETISYISMRSLGNNTINTNIYSLAEAMLYIWLFKRWGYFSQRRGWYIFSITLLACTWIIDNFIWHKMDETNFFFMAVYSIILVFMAINEINQIVISRRGNLLRDSRFLICAGIVIFYSYTSIVSIFWLAELNLSMAFYSNLYLVLEAVNFLINLVFAFAILWAPQKQKFTLQF